MLQESDFKMEVGDKPERYPRTNYKKYTESKIWDKLGKKKAKEVDEAVYNIRCFCGNMITGRVEDFPMTCTCCKTVCSIEDTDHYWKSKDDKPK